MNTKKQGAVKLPVPLEQHEQAALFEWAEYQKGKYPELELMYASANGGKRHIKTAVELKRTGVKSGVPDICLPVSRAGYHALYIELKRRKGGRLSENQKWWLERLIKQGNLAMVCHGWEDARDLIVDYLNSATWKEAPLPLI